MEPMKDSTTSDRLRGAVWGNISVIQFNRPDNCSRPHRTNQVTVIIVENNEPDSHSTEGHLSEMDVDKEEISENSEEMEEAVPFQENSLQNTAGPPEKMEDDDDDDIKIIDEVWKTSVARVGVIKHTGTNVKKELREYHSAMPGTSTQTQEKPIIPGTSAQAKEVPSRPGKCLKCQEGADAARKVPFTQEPRRPGTSTQAQETKFETTQEGSSSMRNMITKASQIELKEMQETVHMLRKAADYMAPTPNNNFNERFLELADQIEDDITDAITTVFLNAKLRLNPVVVSNEWRYIANMQWALPLAKSIYAAHSGKKDDGEEKEKVMEEAKNIEKRDADRGRNDEDNTEEGSCDVSEEDSDEEEDDNNSYDVVLISRGQLVKVGDFNQKTKSLKYLKFQFGNRI